ncbi:MAG: hypothetical protein JJU32_19540 [Phormidium sp. BM_Day4_Bin.17]|nr:hypothetical protein [Phormidium sp. BM_Day4_Bin.17]UCJ12647.1 MAG: hypothetical protein JWS08_02170 [Phormidium sp. PBR-2020]
MGNTLISWDVWWHDICSTLSIFGIIALGMGGLFLIIDNISKEQKQGTLDFIRLTPQSAKRVLLGKLLGVPGLLYLGIAAAIPLHGFAAIQSGQFLGTLLSFYGLLGIACFVLYSFGMLYAIKGGEQALLVAISIGGLASYFGILLAFVLFPFQDTWGGNGNFMWWWMSLNQEPTYLRSFLGISGLFLGSSLFAIVERCYQTPKSTLITKKQSYIFCGVSNIYSLGFLIHWSDQSGVWTSNRITADTLMAYSLLLGLVLLGIAFNLSPDRQSLQDWARYRHQLRQQDDGRRYSFRRDLFWGDKSPSVVAMAVNIAMSIATLGIAILIWDINVQGDPSLIEALLAIIIVGGWLCLYSILIQAIVFSKFAKHRLLRGLSLLVLLCMPSLVLMMLGLNLGTHPAHWLLLVFGTSPYLLDDPSLIQAAIATILGQTLMVVVSLRLFSEQLQRAGQSELKRLMSNSPAKTFSKAPKGS